MYHVVKTSATTEHYVRNVTVDCLRFAYTGQHEEYALQNPVQSRRYEDFFSVVQKKRE